MFAVVGMFLDGSTSPSEPATACRANGIFRENFGQRIRELVIKCRNVGVVYHAINPLRRAPIISAREKSRPLCKAAYTNRSCPELSAYVDNALLRICLGRGRWLRR